MHWLWTQTVTVRNPRQRTLRIVQQTPILQKCLATRPAINLRKQSKKYGFLKILKIHPGVWNGKTPYPTRPGNTIPNWNCSWVGFYAVRFALLLCCNRFIFGYWVRAWFDEFCVDEFASPTRHSLYCAKLSGPVRSKPPCTLCFVDPNSVYPSEEAYLCTRSS